MGKAQTGRNSRIQPNNFSECGRKSVKSEAALGIVVLVVARSDFFLFQLISSWDSSFHCCGFSSFTSFLACSCSSKLKLPRPWLQFDILQNCRQHLGLSAPAPNSLKSTHSPSAQARTVNIVPNTKCTLSQNTYAEMSDTSWTQILENGHSIFKV